MASASDIDSKVPSSLDLALGFVRAVEAGLPRDAIAAYLHPEVAHVEHPNRIAPNGTTRDLAAMLAGTERGRQVLTAQRYTVLNTLCDGDQAALEMAWEGDLAIPLGALAAGATLKAYIGMFFSIRDGRIARIVNYDCYPPF